MKPTEPAPTTTASLPSVRRAVRNLKMLGLSADSTAAAQKLTRTAKFKVGRAAQREDGSILTVLDIPLRDALNRHFNAYTGFRSRVLRDLEAWWLRDEAAFVAMVHSTAKEPYQEKSSAYGWMQTHYVTGKDDADFSGLSKADARSLLWTLAGGLKSFLTRRENVSKDHANMIKKNAELWAGKITDLIREHNLASTTPPSAPPEVNAETLTPAECERYNDWVARARMWGNLVLRQQLVERGTIDRDDAPMPRTLKGYPGFPGSARDALAIGPRTAVDALESAAAAALALAPSLWAGVTPDQWQDIRERWEWQPRPEDAERKPRPRSTRRLVGERLMWLLASQPSLTPEQFGTELLAGLTRSAAKVRAQFARTAHTDRTALMKLANTLNTAAVLALEPLRVAGNHGAFFDADAARHKAFGNLRGALTQPSDETAAVEITGFSLSGDAPQYDGVLAVRRREKGNGDEWAFLFAPPGCAMKTPPGSADAVAMKGWNPSGWLAFTTIGADEEKRMLRAKVWFPDGTKRPPARKAKDAPADAPKPPPAAPYAPPLALPLAFGARMGREYLWHFDRALRDKNDWTPLNARLLRVLPAARRNETEQQRERRLEKAGFYVSITFQREAPPVSEHVAEQFIGVDRGEKVPAAWALVDACGRLIERGLIAPDYYEAQRKFNDTKRELQRTHGDYTGWLRAKERHRAEGLAHITRAVCEVSRAACL